MKSWLKGGLIGVFLAIILIILSLLAGREEFGTIFIYILFFLAYPLTIFLLKTNIAYAVLNTAMVNLFYILLIPYAFLIGAIIGLIIGRFKNRNQEVEK